MDELGINSNRTVNATYDAHRCTPDEVTGEHARTLDDTFGVKLTEKEHKLPTIYWIPKLHKRPYKARFIAGSSSCTTTKISKLITSCLKLVKIHCVSYCKTIKDRTGVNTMWIINNSLDVINVIDKPTFRGKSISTWDFSTLYTSIPHDKLKLRLHELLERVFSTRNKKFIVLNNYGASWSDEKNTNKSYHFTCSSLCNAIDYLIDNIYVSFGGRVFRQVIGIPMGTNSAPLLADLFLHTYEYEFMIRKIKVDIGVALSFNKTFRYIDDLLSINNSNFANYVNEIYPSELELKNTTVSPTGTSYLDTTLNIGDGTEVVKTTIYDKRDDFNFTIVNFPYLDSNIPKNPAYGIYISQLVRYARICSNKHDFMQRHQRLSTKLQQQGFQRRQLQKSFAKFYRSHFDEIQKYGSTMNELRSSILA